MIFCDVLIVFGRVIYYLYIIEVLGKESQHSI